LEIFKNPLNYTRPPSEYLEIFNEFTEKLHHLQIKRQLILDRAGKRDSIDFSSSDKDECIAATTTTTTNASSFSPATNVVQPTENNYSPSKMKSNEASYYNYSPSKNLSPVEFRKPPLPPPKSTPTPLDYQPTTMTQYNSQSNQQYYPPPQTPTSPYSQNTKCLYTSISSANSPVTTPGYSSPPPITSTNTNDLSYNYNIQQHNNTNQYKQQFSLQQQQNYQNQQSHHNHLSTSTSSSSLPSFITNHTNIIPNHPTNLALNNGANMLVSHGGSNLSHNSSRSFSDINDVLIQHPIQNAINTSSNNNFALTPSTATSMSPISSLATTPTSYTTLSSSFLRIFIGTSTAVVCRIYELFLIFI
jgi:hypothetical protein